MRLLHTSTLEFHEFQGSYIPAYAILSHRWEHGEVTYQDVKGDRPDVEDRTGFHKVRQSCRQALRDKLDYIWIDTCCIDKSSSAELSEAINSMFQWYQRSAVCYAYLSDVQPQLAAEYGEAGRTWTTRNPFASLQVKSSKWWTRGWTLQELIAPQIVKFFAQGLQGWIEIGDKRSLIDLISLRTGIDQATLRGKDVRKSSVATRMSWASERQTTRPEDIAYCLLGIFGVHMPLLYGEGNRAFIRLEEEIMKQSDDETLFAWQLHSETTTNDLCGALATSPSQFQGSSNLIPIADSESETPYSMTNKGLRIELLVMKGAAHSNIAILRCRPIGQSNVHTRMGLPIVCTTVRESNYYARDGRHIGPLPCINIHDDVVAKSTPKLVLMKQEPEQSIHWHTGIIVRLQTGKWNYYHPVYFDPSVVASETDSGGSDIYRIPSSYRRGMILCAGLNESHVLILFNTEMRHIKQYACKIVYCPPHASPDNASALPASDSSPEVSSRQALVHKMVTNLTGTAQSDFQPLDATVSRQSHENRNFSYHLSSEFPLLTLYKDMDIGNLNLRRSFHYLPDGGAVYAKIDLNIVNGEHQFILDIEFQDRSTEDQAPWELETNPITPRPAVTRQTTRSAGTDADEITTPEEPDTAYYSSAKIQEEHRKYSQIPTPSPFSPTHTGEPATNTQTPSSSLSPFFKWARGSHANRKKSTS